MYALALLCQLTLPPLPEPVDLHPVIAAPCQCQTAGECTCGQTCECKAVDHEFSVISGVISPKQAENGPAGRLSNSLGYGSPITLAPVADTTVKPKLSDYDADEALRLFKERHRTPVRNILRPSNGAAAPPTSSPAAAPSKPQAPIDRNHATGYWATSCAGGVCTRVWVPYQQTQRVQPVQQPVQQYQYQRRVRRFFR